MLLHSPLAVSADEVCVSLSVVESIETVVAESDSSTKVFINDFNYYDIHAFVEWTEYSYLVYSSLVGRRK